ncbi:MAG: O-antigen ligase family protein [Kiritimatiellae bacterium]|nr:O-antigen ligase family protein [Kiritimatiellia bacterium]
MRDLIDKWTRTDETAFRLLLAGVFAITFSIALGQTLLGLCFAATAVVLVRARRRPALPRVTGFAAAFVLLAGATAVLGKSPSYSLHKWSCLFWLVVLPATATLALWPDRATTVLKAFALGTGVLACRVCIEKPIAAWHALRAGEPYATDFTHALIHQGSMTKGQMLMLGVVAALALVGCARKRSRAFWGWTALLALLVLALVVNLKRGSWFCACLVIFAFALVRRNWKVVGVAVLAAAVLCMHPWVRTRLATLREEFDIHKGGRLTMWATIAPRIVKQYPLGIGYGALRDDRVISQLAPEMEKGRHHLHSNPVQILVETGWPGLGVFLAWLVQALVTAVRLVRRTRVGPPAAHLVATAYLLMLAGLLANGLVEYNFGDTELLTVYAVMMGVGGAAGACAAAARQQG